MTQETDKNAAKPQDASRPQGEQPPLTDIMRHETAADGATHEPTASVSPADDTPAAPTSAPPTAPAPPAARRTGVLVGALLAGAVGGVLTGGLVPLLAPAAPPPVAPSTQAQAERLTALDNAVSTLAPRAALQDLERRFAGVETSLADIRAATQALSARADGAADKATAVTQANATLRADLDAATRDLAALARRQAEVAAAPNPVAPPATVEAPLAPPPVDLAPLETRLSKLEGRVAEAARQASETTEAAKTQARIAVEKTAASPAPDNAAALVVVAEVLQRRIEAGQPFPDELAAAERLGASAESLARLKPFADKGLSSPASRADGLIATLRNSVTQQAGQDQPPAAQPAGWVDRLMSSSASLVRVTPPPGAAEIALAPLVERLLQALARGDDTAALAELDTLPEAQRAATAEAARALRAGAEARAAARALLSASISALGKPRS